jgi:hypothetical protein
VKATPTPAAEENLDNLLQKEPESLEDAREILSRIGKIVESGKNA